MEWYYCLEHRRVEPAGGCPMKNRLGPYRTEAEASRALEKAQARNEAWDNDPRWREPEGAE